MGDGVTEKAELRSGGYGRGAIVIAAVTAVVAGFLLIFGAQAVERIRAVENHWGVYSRDAAEADQLLHHISVAMGYGGFIHNFKNYILRRDLTALERLEETRHTLSTDLAALKKRIISDGEKAALADIQATYTRYDAAVERARVAFERGLSSVEVDILVKIDDRAALAAFAYLDQSFKQRSDLARGETESALKAASSMVLLLLIVVPVVVLLGVLLVLFLRRIVDANGKLQAVRDELATLLRQAPDAILHVAHGGAVVRVNDQAMALFGYSREDFLKLSVEDLIPGKFRQGHPEIRDKAFEGMRPRPIGDGADLVALTHDGREVPVEISLSFSGHGGQRIARSEERRVGRAWSARWARSLFKKKSS